MKIIQECASNGGWQEVKVPSSDGENFYLVLLPPWERTEKEIVCECRSYEVRGRCRHQREALSLVCNWSELDGEPQSVEQHEAHLCPECGGQTRTVLID